jgi:hypothetical protein
VGIKDINLITTGAKHSNTKDTEHTLTSFANVKGLLGRQPQSLPLLRRQRHKHVRRRRIHCQSLLRLFPLHRNVLYTAPTGQWRRLHKIRSTQRVRIPLSFSPLTNPKSPSLTPPPAGKSTWAPSQPSPSPLPIQTLNPPA